MTLVIVLLTLFRVRLDFPGPSPWVLPERKCGLALRCLSLLLALHPLIVLLTLFRVLVVCVAACSLFVTLGAVRA